MEETEANAGGKVACKASIVYLQFLVRSSVGSCIGSSVGSSIGTNSTQAELGSLHTGFTPQSGIELTQKYPSM